MISFLKDYKKTAIEASIPPTDRNSNFSICLHEALQLHFHSKLGSRWPNAKSSLWSYIVLTPILSPGVNALAHTSRIFCLVGQLSVAVGWWFHINIHICWNRIERCDVAEKSDQSHKLVLRKSSSWVCKYHRKHFWWKFPSYLSNPCSTKENSWIWCFHDILESRYFPKYVTVCWTACICPI